MNIFIQGMRRSGTTIAFDVLLEDGRFDCYYEPLADASGEARGGGSGVHAEDFFEKIRATRKRFIEERCPLDDHRLLNHGAPREPALEFETTLPQHVADYIRFMCAQAQDTVIKFTRMACKVHVLHGIDPQAKFVHVVRDPRAVVTSHLYGRDQVSQSSFEGSDEFFTRRTRKTRWASLAFSEALLQRPEYAHLEGLHDFERVLLVWKHLARATHDGAITHFPDRHHILRHDDLIRDQEGSLRAMYRALDLEPSPAAMTWARQHVRGSVRIHDPDHPAWSDAFRRLDLHRELADLGFEP